MRFWHFVDYFWGRIPNPIDLAKDELQEAKISYLKSLSGLDYAQAMVQYDRARIDRLTKYIRQNQE
jgi:hypothetical protein